MAFDRGFKEKIIKIQNKSIGEKYVKRRDNGDISIREIAN